jgi:hypothetical protein
MDASPIGPKRLPATTIPLCGRDWFFVQEAPLPNRDHEMSLSRARERAAFGTGITQQGRISMRALLSFAVALALVVTGLIGLSGPASADEPASAGKVYELRTYKTNPGKLQALHARFRDHTCPLFKKHGIEMIGFWTLMEGDDSTGTLCYIVAFPSVAAQKKAWQAFQNDPEWKKAKADSEKGGVLVKEVTSKNMKATDYSPIQ